MTTRFVQVLRSVSVIAATGALVAGVTYAAVGDLSTASLAGNTLSASAALQIAPDASGAAGTYATTTAGFSASTSGMRFGVERKAGDFWIKNTAATDQSVTMTVPSSPVFTGITAAHVHVRVTKGSATEATGSLADLLTPAGLTFKDHEVPGANGSPYTLYYTIDVPGGGGVSANVSTFDLNFTGTEL